MKCARSGDTSASGGGVDKEEASQERDRREGSEVREVRRVQCPVKKMFREEGTSKSED